MQITRTADYGVRVMTQLALLPLGTRMTVADLAQESGASMAFVGKILQRLVRARLVVSHRGYEGGFELAREANTISLLDIVSALEGPLCLNECLAGGPGCDRASWCAAEEVWKNAQAALAAVLRQATLDTVAAVTAQRSRALGIGVGAAAIAPVAG